VSAPSIRDGLARMTVGAMQPDEAIEKARAYLHRRGWTTGAVDVHGGQRAKMGISGYRVWRVEVTVWR
jgi:hypothetical protein